MLAGMIGVLDGDSNPQRPKWSARSPMGSEKKDWAGVGCYLNMVRVEEPHGESVRG